MRARRAFSRSRRAASRVRTLGEDGHEDVLGVDALGRRRSDIRAGLLEQPLTELRAHLGGEGRCASDELAQGHGGSAGFLLLRELRRHRPRSAAVPPGRGKAQGP